MKQFFLLTILAFSALAHSQTISVDLDNWFTEHPEVRNSIIWINKNNPVPYSSWSDPMKTELKDAVNGILNNQYPFGLSGLPEVTEYGTDVFGVSDRTAWVYYISYVAQSIAADVIDMVPWSLDEMNSTSLSVLFDSREMIEYLSFWGTYCFRQVTPAPPGYIYKFLEDNALIGESRVETIARVIEWCKKLSHYYYMSDDDRISAYYATWHYYGAPPVLRTIEGTVRTPGDTDLRHYTRGCHGTVYFMRTLLQTLNIPVKYIQAPDHAQPYFVHENLFLSHGDDPYTASVRVNDISIPAQELLIGYDEYQAHFGIHLTADERDYNIAYKPVELGVKYLSIPFCKLRCEAGNLGYNDQQCYDYMSREMGLDRVFTIQELNNLNFWNQLDNKISYLGGCSNNYGFSDYENYFPAARSDKDVLDLWFYGQTGNAVVNQSSRIIYAEIESAYDISMLVPHFCISEKATILNYSSGSAVDFSSVKYFRVEAEDHSTSDWRVEISQSSSCEDGYEPDNDIAKANTSAFSTSLGTNSYSRSILATLHDQDDIDVYRLDVTANGTLQVNLPNPPGDYDMKLTRSSNALLVSSHNAGSESMTYTFSAPGDYYIYVYSYAGDYSCTDYNLSVHWDPASEDYLDVSPDSRSVGSGSGTTSFDVSTSVGWSVTDDAAWLTATKTDGTTISVSYDENALTGSRTANITASGTGGLTETVSLTQAGSSASCEDPYEPDNQMYAANTSAFSTLGENPYSASVFGTIHDDQDMDYYSLNIMEEGLLSIEMPAPPVDIDIRLLDASGNDLAFSTSTGSEIINFSVSSPGYYYIYVYGFDGAHSCTDYNLSVQWDPASEDYLDVTPDSRSVGSGSGTTYFDVSTSVGWSVTDDAAWLTATKTDGTTISVSYDENTLTGSRTANITASGTGGLTETVSLTQAGAPISCIDSYESNNSLPTATTSAFSTFADEGKAESILATIHDSLDLDYYRLDISSSGILIIELPDPPLDYDLELFNSSGESIAYSGSVGDENIVFDITSAGDYYVLVYGYDGANACSSYVLDIIWTLPSAGCSIPAGLDVLSQTGDGASLDWSDINDASAYQLRIRNSIYDIWEYYDVYTSSFDVSFGGLGFDMEFQVRTYCGGFDYSEWSSIYQFNIPSGDCLDLYEANNTLSTANTSAFGTLGASNYSKSIHGTIHDVYDNDYYSLSFSSPGILTIELPDPPLDYDMELLNSTWESVGYSGSTGSEFLEYAVDMAGEYYIHIYGYGSASSCDPYLMEINWDSNTTDITEESKSIELKVYPNPSTGVIYLELHETANEDYRIQVIDPTGKILLNKHIPDQGLIHRERVDLGNYPAGIYLIKAFSSSTFIVKKVIITP